MRSASSAAWSIEQTFKPASSATSQDEDPSRKPTRTSQPESFKFSAWGMALGAVADDGDLLILDDRGLAVLLVIDGDSHGVPFFLPWLFFLSSFRRQNVGAAVPQGVDQLRRRVSHAACASSVFTFIKGPSIAKNVGSPVANPDRREKRLRPFCRPVPAQNASERDSGNSNWPDRRVSFCRPSRPQSQRGLLWRRRLAGPEGSAGLRAAGPSGRGKIRCQRSPQRRVVPAADSRRNLKPPSSYGTWRPCQCG